MRKRDIKIIIDTICTMLIGIILGLILGYELGKIHVEDKAIEQGMGYIDDNYNFHFVGDKTKE